MVRPDLGMKVVINKLRPASSGWTVILLSVAALSLAGCGRKGGLDLPPSASGPTNGPVAVAPADSEAQAASRPSLFNPNYGTDAPPAAPRGSKKSFILDPLLDK
jgi:predicted small lipoprotein YifL